MRKTQARAEAQRAQRKTLFSFPLSRRTLSSNAPASGRMSLEAKQPPLCARIFHFICVPIMMWYCVIVWGARAPPLFEILQRENGPGRQQGSRLKGEKLPSFALTSPYSFCLEPLSLFGCDEPPKRTVLMPKIAPYRRLYNPISPYRTLKKQGVGRTCRANLSATSFGEGGLVAP